MSEVLWRQYKSYSGCLVRGVDPFTMPDSSLHFACAVWLAAQLEAPKWGGVQSYDGAGMSAGLLHNIAVMPRTVEQGSLFPLLHAMEASSGGKSFALNSLILSLGRLGWILGHDGRLRLRTTGGLVSGAAIRDEFSPPKGKTPKSGDDWQRATAWARAFHEAFLDRETRGGQISYAIRWLAAGNKTEEIEVYRRFLRQPALDSAVGVFSDTLPPAVDLAMCVYHSFSVNAPTPAVAALRTVAKEEDPFAFAKKLIRVLGKSKYGAWADQPGDRGRSRYDKTRLVVWAAHDCWQPELARQLMPRDL